jgi:hypothetical protein
MHTQAGLVRWKHGAKPVQAAKKRFRLLKGGDIARCAPPLCLACLPAWDLACIVDRSIMHGPGPTDLPLLTYPPPS